MSRATHKRLSVVPAEPWRAALTAIEAETYRETDIRRASEGLYLASLRLQAIPRHAELVEYRAGALERFEAAVKVMREALHE